MNHFGVGTQETDGNQQRNMQPSNHECDDTGASVAGVVLDVHATKGVLVYFPMLAV